MSNCELTEVRIYESVNSKSRASTETSGEFWSPNSLENSLTSLEEAGEFLDDKSMNSDMNSQQTTSSNGTHANNNVNNLNGLGDTDSDSTTSNSEDNWIFSNFDLGWVHVLGAALFLDALWLIHRVLHTVDTAERILYGDVVFIDLTEEGKHFF
ncbi:unnamed protein product [Trichobilharzia regenti]|nr:unnamed protein product [Trichobilharzia regenti]